MALRDAAGIAGQALQQNRQSLAHLGLRHRLGLFFSQRQIRSFDRVAPQQSGIKDQLRVFQRIGHALLQRRLSLGFVINHRKALSRRACQHIHPIQPAFEHHAACQLPLHIQLAAFKAPAFGFMILQPKQVTLAHLRPTCSKRHESRSIAQCLMLLCGAGIEQLAVLRWAGIAASLLMKIAEHGMQPSAEIALRQRLIQLLRFVQTQGSQRKKAVRAGAQIGIAAGAEAHGARIFTHTLAVASTLAFTFAFFPARAVQAIRRWRRPKALLRLDLAQRPGICALLRRVFKQPSLQQRAGLQRRFALRLAPQHVHLRQLHRPLPDLALLPRQRLAAGQPQRFALRSRPIAG